MAQKLHTRTLVRSRLERVLAALEDAADPHLHGFVFRWSDAPSTPSKLSGSDALDLMTAGGTLRLQLAIASFCDWGNDQSDSTIERRAVVLVAAADQPHSGPAYNNELRHCQCGAIGCEHDFSRLGCGDAVVRALRAAGEAIALMPSAWPMLFGDDPPGDVQRPVVAAAVAVASLAERGMLVGQHVAPLRRELPDPWLAWGAWKYGSRTLQLSKPSTSTATHGPDGVPVDYVADRLAAPLFDVKEAVLTLLDLLIALEKKPPAARKKGGGKSVPPAEAQRRADVRGLWEEYSAKDPENPKPRAKVKEFCKDRQKALTQLIQGFGKLTEERQEKAVRRLMNNGRVATSRAEKQKTRRSNSTP